MSTSEKYISEALLKNKPKKPLGFVIKDSAVTTPKIADEAVTEDKLHTDSVSTDKIVDHNVTWDKLTEESQALIKAGTGVDGDLIHDLEEWNDRIATLESAKLTPKTVITATEVVEWADTTTTIPVKISLQDSAGSINNDKNYTDKEIDYSYTGFEDSNDDGEVEFDVPFTTPHSSVITAQGTAKYKGVNVSFDKVTKTVYAVLPSYMGYVESIDSLADTTIQGLQKNVKHSLSGSYNITNSYAQAYFIVAVPKNGAVNGINKIVQHGLMDAVQTISRHDTTGYNVYVCSTAHNQGTYNFIIS